jgi:hypothetical protein
MIVEVLEQNWSVNKLRSAVRTKRVDVGSVCMSGCVGRKKKKKNNQHRVEVNGVKEGQIANQFFVRIDMFNHIEKFRRVKQFEAMSFDAIYLDCRMFPNRKQMSVSNGVYVA